MKMRARYNTSGQNGYLGQSNRTTKKSRRQRQLTPPFASAMAGLGLLFFSCSVYGQAVPLGEAENFSIISSAGLTNTGILTVVNGNIALSPTTSLTGFPPGTITGTVHYNDLIAQNARADGFTAYNTLAGTAFTTNLTQDLGGKTLFPGVYHFNSSAGLTGALTLATGTDANAVFIFQIGSSLTTASNASVVVTGTGAGTPNIFWQVGSSATVGTGTAFAGNIFALASITMTTGSTLSNGRLVALNGAVTLDNIIVAAIPVIPAAPGRYWNGKIGNTWSGNFWSTTVAGLDQVVLGSNVDVVFSVNNTPINQNTNLDIDATISSLTVNDSAAVTIGGSNKLTISSTGLITGIKINNGAGLTTISSRLELGNLSQVITVNNAAGMLISGVVSGTNGLTKAGTGVLTLTAVETYTGATVVSGGTLQLGNGTIVGTSIASSNSVLVAPTGCLSINLANGETFGNSVTDNGEIRWIAQGTNTQASTSVFSGTGSMRITASGTTNLFGNNTFSGGTTINTPGDVFVGNVNSNTSSPFGTGVLTIDDGTIDTVNSQLLQINVGGYVQTGGEIAMHLQGTTLGSYTRFDVAETASLSGGTVFVYDLSGNYVPYGGDEQNIIHTNGTLMPEFTQLSSQDTQSADLLPGGLEGTFASNTPESHFYNAAFDLNFFYHQGDTLLYPTITYDPDNAYVTWVQDSFRSVPGLTPNQDAVGGGLDDYVDQTPGLPDDVVAYLNGQNIADLPAMYDLIAPDELTAIFQMGFTAAGVQNASIQRHLERVRRSTSTSTLSTRTHTDSKGGLAEETYTTQATNPWNFFFEGTGGSADVDGDSNASGYDFDSTGGMLGADMRVNDGLVIGILGSYANSDANLVNGGSIDAESYSVAAYATVYKNGYFLDALIGAGFNSYDTRRSSLLGYAEGNPDGWQLNTMLNTGYDFHRGKWTLTPNASIAYTRVSLDSFDETGSLTPLSYPTQDQNSLRSELGLTLAYAADLNGIKVTPQVRIAWQHEFMDSTQSMDSRFIGGTGPTFTVSGPHMDRDRAVLSAGISAEITPSVTIYGFYDGLLGSSNYNSNQVSAGVKIAC
jgi:outer membrane autotransporter protein